MLPPRIFRFALTESVFDGFQLRRSVEKSSARFRQLFRHFTILLFLEIRISSTWRNEKRTVLRKSALKYTVLWINHLPSILYFYDVEAFMCKAPRTSSRPSLVFLFFFSFIYSGILKQLSRGYRRWSRMNHIVCAPWKRFICYVEWRGDHGSSLLVVIIPRSFLSPSGARNFPRYPPISRGRFILRRTFICL